MGSHQATRVERILHFPSAFLYQCYLTVHLPSVLIHDTPIHLSPCRFKLLRKPGLLLLLSLSELVKLWNSNSGDSVLETLPDWSEFHLFL